jgi:UDPglucose--hexose-1-phosphate uridylyltransferase
MTPPAVLVYLSANNGIKKDRDTDGFRHKDWVIRCVPNLYPAFTPPVEGEKARIVENAFVENRATGHHEVIVESPNHDEHPGTARVSQLIHVINAQVDRLRELSSKPYVKYVSIFRNHGLEAGASLSHAHTQMIATPFIPKTVEEEFKASEETFNKEKHCAFCNIVAKEEKSSRFIWKNNEFVVFAPWASVHPFEFWIFPRRHQCCLLDLSQREVESFAKTLRVCLGALKTLLDDPPYNYGFHQLCSATCNYFHWHLEVYPRLSIWAGFEKNTGMFINVVSPEDAAASLREAALEEERRLSAV